MEPRLATRSLLLLPADAEGLVEVARAAAADVVVIDLAGREAARRYLREAIAAISSEGKAVHVRVSDMESGATRDDLAAVVGAGLDGVHLARTQAARHVRAFDVLLREQEMHNQVRAGSIALFPEIATARGLLRCEEVVLASTRVGGLVLDGDAFADDLGVPRTPAALEHARRVLVTCCVAYGLQAIDSAPPDPADEAALLAEADYARSIGFRGKLALRPEQLATINQAFT